MFNHPRAIAAALVLLAASSSAFAQPYPSRPIRLIVPSAPGGAPDISSRMLAQELSRQVNQQVVVDNRAGASNTIGTEIVVKAPADGYTVGYGVFSMATNPSLMAKMRYDALRDLQMVVHVASTPNVLAVSPSLPVKSVPELIDHARKTAGKLLYATGGAGTSLHLAMELFMSMSGAILTHVPYKGVDQAALAVVGGEAQVIFHNVSPMFPHIKAGRMRGLAVTTLKRVHSLPDLPTVSEAGLAGYEIAPWGGIIAPAGLPRPILNRLNAEFNVAIKSRTVQDFYASVGVEPQGGTPEKFTEFVRNETEKWGSIIKRLNIKAG
jgi:tripartite-type tricarboxylate transporter receptor subunit TctC